MTPAQQSALETVAGRMLTAGDIAAIDPLLPARNDVEIALILSAGRTKTQPTPIGIGTVLAVMAPSGGMFLHGLRQMAALQPPTEDSANIEWSLEMIKQGTFDVGHPVTRAQLAAFAQSQPAMEQAITALLSVAEVADPIHYNAVSDALNIAEGRMTLGG